MDTPEYIYKYQSLNINNLSALNTSQIWFSDLYHLNDPFEATYEFTPELIFGNQSSFPSIDDTVTKIIKNSAICSFTKVCPTDVRNFKTNTLMWSHYAGQFSGICIEFNTEKLLTSLQEDKRFTIRGEDVNYSDVIHSYNKPIEAFGDQVMFKKHSAWDYENEFRILCKKDPFDGENFYKADGLHRYNPESIRNVYVGGRLNRTEMELLNVIVRSVNSNIEITSLLINNRYSYGIEPCDIDEDY